MLGLVTPPDVSKSFKVPPSVRGRWVCLKTRDRTGGHRNPATGTGRMVGRWRRTRLPGGWTGTKVGGVTTHGMPAEIDPVVRDHVGSVFTDGLEDFISESRFAWGQRRELQDRPWRT